MKLIIVFILFSFNIIAQNKFNLKEDLQIDDNKVGLIQGIGVDNYGNIYVGDLINKNVMKYNNKGDFLEEIGRRGSGPGEFRSITGLELWKDTLFILDLEQSKISAFNIKNKNKLIYEIKLPIHPNGLNPVVLGNERIGIKNFWVINNQYFLVLYGKYTSSNNLNKTKNINGLLITRKGAFKNLMPAFEVYDREMIIYKMKNGFSTAPMPYGKTGIINADINGNIYYMNNDEKFISKFIYSTNETKKINVALEKVFVSSNIKNILLDEIPGEIGKLLDKANSKFPEYLPVCENFFISENLIWLSAYSKNINVHTWFVFDQSGNKITSIDLKRNDIFLVGKGNFLYGIRNKSFGSQQIIRYKIVGKK
ncbi:MAG: 6-bladed beta-propeller [Stygiobacter sp.]|jgi:hypothetical protein|uniref:6-bladed beta-propeller n=1 Tax=Stygiobacter electus TaxID=3032292 RepID=A0AAE3TCG6_9BACT|nr:6-bladed beta-propeller [Stygiobacter electus]MDF1611895.1 6-bladed beta-propeller [Stygiobacter electus]